MRLVADTTVHKHYHLWETSKAAIAEQEQLVAGTPKDQDKLGRNKVCSWPERLSLRTSAETIVPHVRQNCRAHETNGGRTADTIDALLASNNAAHNLAKDHLVTSSKPPHGFKHW